MESRINIIDCTIRDGGLINNWDFDVETVRQVYTALSQAKVDYMEIGYKVSQQEFLAKSYGKWKNCMEDDIKAIMDGIATKIKLAVMVDVGRVEESDIIRKNKSVFDLIRVATYVDQMDEAIRLSNHIMDKGYDVFINIMAVSQAQESELLKALTRVEKETKVLGVYLVDSFGALYSDQIRYLTQKYRSILETKQVGIHAHNNQQLAFANTIEALGSGAAYLDATIYGIGRSSGNCPMELLISYLRNSQYDICPILDVISKVFLPLKQSLEWGYNIPYMLTGIMNAHPIYSVSGLDSLHNNNFSLLYQELLNKGRIETVG